MFEKLRGFKAAVVVMVLLALLMAVGGLVISQAAGGQGGIQATVYDDAVRFTVQNEKVAVLRAEVFNLSGKRLFDSGPVMGKALDWSMSNEAGERVAHGVYLYVITAWDSQGELVKSQVGKLALVPGGVGLGQAPALVSGSEGNEPVTTETKDKPVRALAVDQDHHTESWAFGQIGIGTMSPDHKLHISSNARDHLRLQRGTDPFVFSTFINSVRGWIFQKPVGNVAAGQNTILRYRRVGTVDADNPFWNGVQYEGHTVTESGSNRFPMLTIYSRSATATDPTDYEFILGVSNLGSLPGNLGLAGNDTNGSSIRFGFGQLNNNPEVMRILRSGKVGIGTTNPSAALEVHGTTTNLLALYDPADPTGPKFKVQKDGDVYADGSYNCGLASGCFNTGTGADVAERIDVSEAVEPGDVVEIDPENPGLYRKARVAYSTRVAGVISTAPAITLGNAFDPKADKWTDSRPLLALAGRVPVKVTTENGPIQVGDFLTTSSIPGYAMRCSDLSRCTGAILGKALEPLEEGTGVIMVQVTLR